ncbi:NUDIX domain-containing protein [Actinocorallia aurantiaca]|uniref:NUDIX domain-containing protein n=1 Tax=Actinocorallia aurantiaca TaxID=46204 RepID=A0ABP6GG20_9ACTN
MGAVVVRREELLMVLRGRPPGAGLWSVPGGRVEPGESDVEALVRELREETGLAVAVGDLLGSVEVSGFDVHDYLCTVTGGRLEPGDDAADARWVPLAEVAGLPVTDGLVATLRSWRVIPE